MALGFVYFGLDVDIPKDAAFDVQVAYSESEGEFDGDLVIAEVSSPDGRIVGLLRNESDQLVTGPIGVDVYCFDGDELLSTFGGFADQEQVNPGETVSFSVDLYEERCPSFLVGGSGYLF